MPVGRVPGPEEVTDRRHHEGGGHRVAEDDGTAVPLLPVGRGLTDRPVRQTPTRRRKRVDYSPCRTEPPKVPSGSASPPHTVSPPTEGPRPPHRASPSRGLSALFPLGKPPPRRMASRLSQSYIDDPGDSGLPNPAGLLTYTRAPRNPGRSPAPQVPLELQELITPRPCAGEAATGRPQRQTHGSSFVAWCHTLQSTVNLDHLGPPEERSVWILCSRFERRVHGSVNACGCFGDGKCPLRPAMAAVLRTDGTGGPRRPGTDRRQRVLVFTAPFAQADVEDDLDRAVAAHSITVPADRTASDAHSQPAPTAPGAEAADSHARTERLTSRPIPPKKVGQRRGDASDQRLGRASHLARRHPRPTRRSTTTPSTPFAAAHPDRAKADAM